ncbi:hypothetical protein BT69DRAFT_1285352 [Atractiella rhizophila]|nr:hypothetical protein BT69DRAFT_1285352 [Atractiella rhizophila]
MSSSVRECEKWKRWPSKDPQNFQASMALTVIPCVSHTPVPSDLISTPWSAL